MNHDSSGVYELIPNLLGLPFNALVRLNGNRDFDVEKLIAYELGYRVKPVDSLFFDLAAFYYVDDVRTFEGVQGTVKIPSYLRGDFRLGWRPRRELEFSLALLNAFQDTHQEWTSEFGYLATRIPCSFYGRVTGRF